MPIGNAILNTSFKQFYVTYTPQASGVILRVTQQKRWSAPTRPCISVAEFYMRSMAVARTWIMPGIRLTFLLLFTCALSSTSFALNEEDSPNGHFINYIKNGFNTSVNPCENFYDYVCSKHPSSSDDVQVSDFNWVNFTSRLLIEKTMQIDIWRFLLSIF